MQQKIIIARWLLLEPSLLILDEPTKGVDIGTRTSIYAMLRQVAGTGVGIVVISSDFEELLSLCERIVVISDGLSIANVPSGMLNEEKLTLFADLGVGIVVISSDFEELLSLCERIVVISDGLSIANVPSGMLNEEKLTLFA